MKVNSNVIKTSVNFQIVGEFLNAFEAGFHSDWAHTNSMLGIESEAEEQSKKYFAQIGSKNTRRSD